MIADGVKEPAADAVASGYGPWYPGHHVPERAEKAAVIIHEAHTVMTFGELDATANRLARFFRREGLGVGDHVSLWLENELEYPALWWGAHYAGLHYTLISARLTPGEVAYIVKDSGARLVLAGAGLHALSGAELERSLAGSATVIVADGRPTGLTSRLAALSSDPLPEAVEGSPMLYSSGTTGHPKGVKRPLSGAALGTAPGVVSLATFVFGIDHTSVYLSPAPLYHAAPFGFVSGCQALGATAIVMERFDPIAYLTAIERHGVTHTQLVPTMFVRLLSLPETERRRFDLSSLQCAIHAGAPCPVPVKEQMMDWWGPVIHEYYSGTEGVGLTYCSPTDWLAHPGSVGKPLVGEVHIVDDNGAEVPAGVDGGVYFGGPATFEYHNDPAKTAGSYLVNGWATFGDIGHVDEDGFLYLTDRRAHMIIVGGVNVYPQEAENLLIAHPAVLDAAVFGIPNPEWGEEVKAVVQPADPDAVDGLAGELMAYLRANLASIKCPRSIDFRAELPREPNGKLLKLRLREEYLDTASEVRNEENEHVAP